MYKFRLICFLISAIGLTSCNKSYMNLEVLVPAKITLPQHIKKIGIANRSLPDKENTFLNILEGFVTGESIFADREASDKCIHGLFDKLNNSPRFQAVLIEGANLKGTGTRDFPEALNGNRVDELCKQYQVDALILLETFDSNVGLHDNRRNVVRKDKNGKEYTAVQYNSDLTINASSGWRVYDFTTRQIADENRYTDQKSWSSSGNTLSESRRNLPSKREAINNAGYFAGQQYAVRISPNWVNENRYYFTKGHDDFKIARGYIRAGNWDKAIEIWNKLSLNGDKKIAGRACHNMAFACEKKGQLDLAFEWAKKAYQVHGLRSEASYINHLQKRIMDQKKLGEQMGN